MSFSFSYSVPPGGSKKGKDGVTDLTDLTLYEVGPTPVGANPATELLAVKGGHLTTRERRSAMSTIREQHDELAGSLKALVDPAADQDRELTADEMAELGDGLPRLKQWAAVIEKSDAAHELSKELRLLSARRRRTTAGRTCCQTGTHAGT